MTDLVVAARRYLVADAPLRGLLGSSESYSTWVFRWRPYVSVEGTGRACLVLSLRGGPAPNPHNTMRTPVLMCEAYCDELRNPDGSPVGAATAEASALDVAARLDALLHLVKREGAPWTWGRTATEPGVRVLGSESRGEPEIVDVPGADGVVRLTCRYEVSVG